MEKSFGANIHIYRSFHGFKNKHSGILFEEERWQAARGGMVFYSTQPKEWAKVANGEFDDVLMGYAKKCEEAGARTGDCGTWLRAGSLRCGSRGRIANSRYT